MIFRPFQPTLTQADLIKLQSKNTDYSSFNVASQQDIQIGSSSDLTAVSAPGQYSTAFGFTTIAYGLASFAHGRSTVASGDSSYAGGIWAEAPRFAEWARGSEIANNRNRNHPQYGSLCYGITTTNDAATEIFLDTAGYNYQFYLETGTTYAVQLRGVAVSATGSTSGQSSSFHLDVLIKNSYDNTVTLIGGAPPLIFDVQEGSMGGIAVTITADDTNKALKVQVTGMANYEINWFIQANYQKATY